MRVTHQTLQDTWLRDLQGRLGAIDNLNRQVGSGLRLAKPSDDPSGASRVVRIDEVVARNEQYLKNIGEALSVNRDTDSALDQAYQRLVQAKAIAVEGADSASVSVGGSFAALADELGGIRTGLLQIANGRHEGKFLFSGTAEDRAPFAEGGGPYRGDSNQLRVNLGNGQTAALNVSGDRAFREVEVRTSGPLPLDAAGQFALPADLVFQVSDGTATSTVSLGAGNYAPDALAGALNAAFSASGANLQARIASDGALTIAFADTLQGGEISLEEVSGGLGGTLGLAAGTKNVFGLLDDLEAALRGQDSRAVGGLLDRLERALEGLSLQRGVVGSQGRNLEFVRDRIEAYNITSRTLKSEIEGVDLPQAITKLSAEEQAYQTALAAGARILNVSLLDFLR